MPSAVPLGNAAGLLLPLLLVCFPIAAAVVVGAVILGAIPFGAFFVGTIVFGTVPVRAAVRVFGLTLLGQRAGSRIGLACRHSAETAEHEQ